MGDTETLFTLFILILIALAISSIMRGGHQRVVVPMIYLLFEVHHSSQRQDRWRCDTVVNQP